MKNPRSSSKRSWAITTTAPICTDSIDTFILIHPWLPELAFERKGVRDAARSAGHLCSGCAITVLAVSTVLHWPFGSSREDKVAARKTKFAAKEASNDRIHTVAHRNAAFCDVATNHQWHFYCEVARSADPRRCRTYFQTGACCDA